MSGIKEQPKSSSGGTNWKLILVVTVVSLVLGGALMYGMYSPPIQAPTEWGNPGMASYLVDTLIDNVSVSWYRCYNYSSERTVEVLTNRTQVIQNAINNLTVSGGKIFLKECAFNYSLTIPANVSVVESLNGVERRFGNIADSQGSPYTISIDTVYATYYLGQDSAGTIINSWSSTNVSAVGNAAIGNLTSARTSKETVLFKGSFTFDSPLYAVNYTEIQLQGTMKKATSSNFELITTANHNFQYTDITINGGDYDGNRANTATSNDLIRLVNTTNAVVKNIVAHDSSNYGIVIGCEGLTDVDVTTGSAIRNCVVYNITNDSVVMGTVGGVIDGCTISNNDHYNLIALMHGVGCKIISCTLENCASDGAGVGIEGNSVDNSVTGITFINCIMGVKFYGNGVSHSNSVIGCNFVNCPQGISTNPIGGAGCWGTTISGNNFNYTGSLGYYGMYLVTDYATVTGNVIVGYNKSTDGQGIYLYGAHMLVTGNTVRKCRFACYLLGDTASSRIIGNDFGDNSGSIYVGVTSNTMEIWNNVGFVTEMSGSVLNDTATTFSISCWFAGTPTGVWCSFNTSAISGYSWTSPDAWHITVTVTGTSLPAAMTCYWKGEYNPFHP